MRLRRSAAAPTVAAPARPALTADETWWDRTLFRSFDTADRQCPAVIDVTGRPRHLVYGPYASLGAGIWRARVWLDLCPDAAMRPLTVEFGAAHDHAGVALPIGRSGRLEVALTHAVDGQSPVEVRLWLAKAAFHGEVRFLGAAVSRLGDAADARPG